jgi:hypothetical protein
MTPPTPSFLLLFALASACLCLTPLDIVFVGRNDDYGGGFLPRSRAFLRTLCSSLSLYPPFARVVVVDWNPPFAATPLAQALFDDADLALDGCDDVISVTVPPSVHHSYRHHKDIALFEYRAKNAGIRVAAGREDAAEYLLVLNPDVVLSREAVAWLAEGNFEDDVLYRADRYDFKGAVAPNATADEVLAMARANLRQIKSMRNMGSCLALGSDKLPAEGTVEIRGAREEGGRRPLLGEVSTWSWEGVGMCEIDVAVGRGPDVLDLEGLIVDGARAREGHLPYYFGPAPVLSCKNAHVMAPGDFLLASREVWTSLRGFPELDGSGVADSVFVVSSAMRKFRQQVLPPPIRVFHMDHSRGELQGRPGVALSHFEETCRDWELSEALKNDPGWGLKGREEVVVTHFSRLQVLDKIKKQANLKIKHTKLQLKALLAQLKEMEPDEE